MKKLLALIALFSQCALAGLPPTTAKDSADSVGATSFNFQFPNFTGTHTGTTFSLGVNSMAGGGTGNGSLAATAGGVLVTNGTNVQNAGVGTTGQFLKSNGTATPTWGAPTVYVVPPVVTALTSGSSTFDLTYGFLITSGNATAGATYTNNSVTFTVYQTVSSATFVQMSGSGPPTSTGTLTLASGTGDATITFTQYFKPFYLEVQMVGGGGGGSGGGTAPAAGGNGGNTTFGAATADGGQGGSPGGSSNGGSGGGASLGSGMVGIAVTGGGGAGGGANNGFNLSGPSGAASALGGGGSSNWFGGGGAAAPQSGGGGGGGRFKGSVTGDI